MGKILCLGATTSRQRGRQGAKEVVAGSSRGERCGRGLRFLALRIAVSCLRRSEDLPSVAAEAWRGWGNSRSSSTRARSVWGVTMATALDNTNPVVRERTSVRRKDEAAGAQAAFSGSGLA